MPTHPPSPSLPVQAANAPPSSAASLRAFLRPSQCTFSRHCRQPRLCRRTAPTCAAATPLTPLTFRNRRIYIKRDDLLHLPPLHANKARKLHALLQKRPLPASLVSYGGPHSNNMLALAAVARQLGIPFSYVTRPQPPNIAELPGNFSRAVVMGMRHISVSSSLYRDLFTDCSPQDAVQNLHRFLNPPEHTLIIPQGAATPLAEPGIHLLAAELVQQITQLHQSTHLALKRPVVFLPAGTGTTAYYLNKHLRHIATVIAVPVSGDERYLVRQMRWLQQMSGDTQTVLPGVLRPRLRGTFADIRIEKLKMWQEMCRAASDYEFDLVYAPKAWEEVMLAVEEGRIAADGEDLMYYHSGGLEGNDSMLGRFRQKGLL